MKVRLRDKATTQSHTVEVHWESDTEWHGIADNAEHREAIPYMKSCYELVEDEPEDLTRVGH